MAHTFNAGIWEAETGISLSLRPAWGLVGGGRGKERERGWGDREIETDWDLTECTLDRWRSLHCWLHKEICSVLLKLPSSIISNAWRLKVKLSYNPNVDSYRTLTWDHLYLGHHPSQVHYFSRDGEMVKVYPATFRRLNKAEFWGPCALLPQLSHSKLQLLKVLAGISKIGGGMLLTYFIKYFSEVSF